jgi:3D (Asp-Asp-Asp) domain-containing protein
VAIRVVRVKEEMVIEQDPISFETAWQPDPNLELDHQRLDQEGADGVTKRRIRTVYEDGEEVEQVLEAEWVDCEPTNKIIAYGTKIVLRELETPDGVLKYWRKIRVLATSYTAATSGKSPDHPQYGVTFLGWPMRKGIVAVDPTVINLETEMYVPGYGVGVAADTGGKIRGRHIDLGYEEDDLQWWYKWVDVYLLAPAPPADQIRWVLPGWPREH